MDVKYRVARVGSAIAAVATFVSLLLHWIPATRLAPTGASERARSDAASLWAVDTGAAVLVLLTALAMGAGAALDGRRRNVAWFAALVLGTVGLVAADRGVYVDGDFAVAPDLGSLPAIMVLAALSVTAAGLVLVVGRRAVPVVAGTVLAGTIGLAWWGDGVTSIFGTLDREGALLVNERTLWDVDRVAAIALIVAVVLLLASAVAPARRIVGGLGVAAAAANIAIAALVVAAVSLVRPSA